MRIFREIEEYKVYTKARGEKPLTAIAIGKFDGIHKGHGKLINTLKEEAEREQLKTLLFTFDKPFSSYFTGERAEVLTTNPERVEALREWGIDYLIEYPLRKDTVDVSAESFVSDILVGVLNMRLAAAGPDMTFGSGGKGNISFLRQESRGRYKVIEVPKVKYEGITVSSSYVRERLKAGDLETVDSLLGRPYSITGKVTHGRKLGKKVLDMPTINVFPEKDKLMPPFGVYFSKTVVGSEEIDSITNIGVKPTVKEDSGVNAETYLYDFEEDLYGETVRIELLHFRRGEKKFDSLELLKEAMHADMLEGKRYFNR